MDISIILFYFPLYIYIDELAQGSFDTIVSQNGRMIVWINIKGNENVGSVLI